MRTPPVKMIWTGKPQYLNGRTIRKGDSFTATSDNAKIWKVTRKAVEAPPVIENVFTPEPVSTQSRGTQSGEIDALRAQYESEKGSAPDRRWGLGRLRSELGMTAGRYMRRDMRAED